MNRTTEGEIVKGTRGASGLAYGLESLEKGTIAKQRPFFKSAGVEGVDTWYEGTINISIEPRRFEILIPDYEITAEWKHGVIETFRLVGVILKHNGKSYTGYVYYPCPSAIKAHPDTIIEILAEKVEALQYGDHATIEYPDDKIRIID